MSSVRRLRIRNYLNVKVNVALSETRVIVPAINDRFLPLLSERIARPWPIDRDRCIHHNRVANSRSRVIETKGIIVIGCVVSHVRIKIHSATKAKGILFQESTRRSVVVSGAVVRCSAEPHRSHPRVCNGLRARLSFGRSGLFSALKHSSDCMLQRIRWDTNNVVGCAQSSSPDRSVTTFCSA